MGIKEVIKGSDNVFDRKDLFMWIGLIGLMALLVVEIRAKILSGDELSEWTYLSVLALIIGRPAIISLLNFKFGGKNVDINDEKDN